MGLGIVRYEKEGLRLEDACSRVAWSNKNPGPGPELGYLKPVLCGRKLIKRTKDDSILSAAEVSGHM